MPTALQLILVVLLVLLLIGMLPTWPYSGNWGFYPSGGVGLILIVLVLLLALNRGKLPRN
jgi:hypothetical protein